MTHFAKGRVSSTTGSGIGAENIAQAIRALKGDDTLFVKARDGETLIITQQQIITAASRIAGSGKFSVRVDHERNGVLVFLRSSARR